MEGGAKKNVRPPLLYTVHLPPPVTRRAHRSTVDAAASSSSYTPFSAGAEDKTVARAFVRGLEKQLVDERTSFSSFATLCGTALHQARALGNDNHPNQPHHVIVAVAVMLLVRLSTTLERYGPLLRELLVEILPAVYSALDRDEARSKLDEVCRAGLSCDFLLRHSLQCAISSHREASLSDVSLRVERLSAALSQNAKLVAKVTTRECTLLQRRAFTAWRACVTERGRDVERWLGARRRAIEKSRKRVVLAEWRRFTAEGRERKALFAAARNSDLLNARIADLSRQVTLREQEIEKQRTAKDKTMLRVRSAEALLERERLDTARLQTRLADAESIGQSLMGMAGVIMGRMEAALPLLAVVSPRSVMHAAVPRGGGGGDDRRRRSELTPRAPLVHVKAALIQWLNDRLAESSAASFTVSNLTEDLSDGRVYVVIVSLLTGSAPPNGMESSSERTAYILHAARQLDIDGGVTQQDLMSAAADVHTGLVCRMLLKYAMAERKKGGTVSAQRGGSSPAESRHRRDSPSGPLSAEAMVSIMSRFERLHVELMYHRQWQHIALSAINYAVKSTSGKSDDAAQSNSDKLQASTALSPAKLRALLPDASLHFAKQTNASNNPTNADDDTDAAVKVQDEIDDALTYLSSELWGVLTPFMPTLASAHQHYCTLTASDEYRPNTIDSSGWVAFLSDTKVAVRVGSRTDAVDGILRAHDGRIDLVDWPEAVFKLFLLQRESQQLSKPAANVEEIADEFKQFLQSTIIPKLPRSLLSSFSDSFHAGDVQDELKRYREPLRRIFSELALRESSLNGGPVNRFRLTTFLNLFKDLKLACDEQDIRIMFASVRLVVAAADGTISSSTSALPGLGYLGFTAVVFALSLVKESLPFRPPASSLRTFLTSVLFNHFRDKLKLKW